MKIHLLLRPTLALLLPLITVTIASSQSAAGIRYRVVDLGADNAIGNDITDCRQIVGSKDFGDVRDAAFWPNLDSSAVDLGTLPSDAGTRGYGINSHGQMVGFSFNSDFVRPVFWASSQSAPIELTGLPAGYSVASDVNVAGNIVGQVWTDTGVLPVFWSNSNTAATYLPEVSDELPFGVALSTNDSGNILGDACSPDFAECHVAFWTDPTSTPVALASPDGKFIYTDVGLSGDFAIAHALNNAGSMVGYAYNTDGSQTRAVFWGSSSSPAVILKTNGDFRNGSAEGINDRGQIVGTAYNRDFSNFHPFFWANPTKPGIDLNTVIPPNSGWELVIARSINNRGEITGGGFLNGDEAQHAVVLIPVRDCSDVGAQ